MKNSSKSPYLGNINRLAHIIAAIQVMSTYKFYKLEVGTWASRISGNNSNSNLWREIFREHPEFFRFNEIDDKVSLVWRRSKQRRYHVDLSKELTLNELDNLDEETKNKRISRNLLSSSDIETLISTAIELHNRALENRKDERWWIIPLISAVSGFIGVILGAMLG